MQCLRQSGHLGSLWCSEAIGLSHSAIRRLWGHGKPKQSGAGNIDVHSSWAAGQGVLGSSWANHDRIASALLESQSRSSPQAMSDSQSPGQGSAGSACIYGERGAQRQDRIHVPGLYEANIHHRDRSLHGWAASDILLKLYLGCHTPV